MNEPQIAVPEPRITIPVEVCGFFKIEKGKADANGDPIPGTEEVVADWFPNLITDQGLNYLGNYPVAETWLNAYAHVGDGTANPTALDTSLGAFKGSGYASLGSTSNAQGSAPYYGSVLTGFRINPGVATGVLTEVGSSTQSTNGGIFSRALIVDGAGNNTSITKLVDEYLNIWYEVRQYPPLGQVTGSITLASIPYAWTLQAARVTNNQAWGAVTNDCKAFANGKGFWGALGPITGTPSGGLTTSDNTIYSWDSYSVGDFWREVTVTWRIDAGLQAFRCVTIGTPRGEFQIGFVPDIPKDNTKQLSLKLRVTWARKTLP